VRNRRVFQRHGNHLVAGEFAAATNGVRDFRRLAERDADFALFVADDDERAEIETASALDDFRGAVDEHHLLDNSSPPCQRRFHRHRTTPRTATATTALTTAPPCPPPRPPPRFGCGPALRERRGCGNFWNVFVFSHNKFSGSG
jgi:hypothetical protein